LTLFSDVVRFEPKRLEVGCWRRIARKLSSTKANPICGGRAVDVARAKIAVFGARAG
jgi:hypothetical protein